MTTPVNDRDVFLAAAATRDVDPRASKYVLLTPNTPIFRVSAAGVGYPTSIDITAMLVNLPSTATVQFGIGSGGTLTGTGLVRTLAFSSMTVDTVQIGVSVTDLGQTYNQSVTISKVADGSSGTGTKGDTGNTVIMTYLYKWSTVAPALPTGTATCTTASGKNTSYAGSDGWYVDPPANSGAPGLALYVAQKSISVPFGTATTAVTYSAGATVAAYASNGLNGSTGQTGLPGIKNTQVRAYQWSNGPAPTISGTAVYTWASQDYNVTPSGWSKTKPNAPSTGYTLYEATVYIVDTTGAATTGVDFGTAAVVGVSYMPINGVKGDTGQNGTAGKSVAIAYNLVNGNTLAATPATFTAAGTALPTTGTWGDTNAWTAQPSVPAAGQSVYQSNGIYDGTNTVWGVPYLSSLRVGSLSALSINTGDLLITGTMSTTNNAYTITNAGLATFKSMIIKGSDGTTILTTGVSSAAISGTLNLTTAQALLVGTASDGIFMGNTGLYGKKAGVTQFSISTDGTAYFAGTLAAGIVKASMIDSAGLLLKAADGTIILGSGNTLNPAYATPGTMNSDLPVVNNMVVNSLPSDATPTFSAGSAIAAANWEGPIYSMPGKAADPYSVYSRLNRGTVWIHSKGTQTSGTTIDLYDNGTLANRVDVVPGTRYEFGVGLSVHRCLGKIVAVWYKADGTYINEASGNVVSYPATWNDAATTGDLFPRSTVFVTMPADAAKVMIVVRLTNNGGNDAYVFASEFYMGVAGLTQTAPTKYTNASVLAAQQTANKAAIDAGAAAAAALAANNTLAVIADDNKLSRGEKPQVIADWNAIDAERLGIVNQAAAMGVSSTAYQTNFTSLSNYLIGIDYGNLATDSTITGSVFRSAFVGYYSEKQALLNAIAAKAATISTWTGTAGKPADSELLNSAIEVGGRNLLVDSGFERGGVHPLTERANVTGFSVDGAIVGSYLGTKALFFDGSANDIYLYMGTSVPVVPGKTYMISYYSKTASAANKTNMRPSSYILRRAANATQLGHDALAMTNLGDQIWTRAVTTWLCPADTYFIELRFGIANIVSGNYGWMAVDCIQIEEGNKVTQWNAAPEDNAAIVAAVKAIASDAATAATSARGVADAAAIEISNIISDGILSKSEKPQVYADWLAVDGERAGIETQASNLGVSSSAYHTAFLNLGAYLTNIGPGTAGWYNTTINSNIDPAAFRNTWTAYYVEKQNLLNAIAAAAATKAAWASVAGKPADSELLNSAIQIGGRNLYKKTLAFQFYNGGYLAAKLPTGFQLFGAVANNSLARMTNIVPANGTYTLSFDLQVGSANGYPLTIDLCDNTPVWIINPTTTVQHFSRTMTVSNWTSSVYNFLDFDGLSGQHYFFTNVKLEAGNKETAYTPAPEDVAADIALAYNTAADAALAATNARTEADKANVAVSAIADDNVLAKGEKGAVVAEWNRIATERQNIADQAAALGLSVTNYNNNFNALANYLNSIPLGWNVLTTNSAIDGPTFRANFANYYAERQWLLNATAAAAATKAVWTGVAGKPADSAILNSAATVNPNLLETLDMWNIDGNNSSGVKNGWPWYYPETNLPAGLYAANGQQRVYPAISGSALNMMYSRRLNLQANTSYTLSFKCASDGVSSLTCDLNPDTLPETTFQIEAGIKQYQTTWAIGNLPEAGDCIVRMFNSASNFQFLLYDVKLERGATKTAWSNDVIHTSNATQYIMPNAVNNSMFGGDLYSSNWNGYAADTDLGRGWLLSRAGDMYINQLHARGAVMGGAYSGYAWPAAGQGGFYLGPQGLLLGSNTSGSNGYFQIEANGNVWAPGFQLVGRQVTLTSPIIVSPKISTTFSCSIPTLYLTAQGNGSTVVTGMSPSISNGSGSYSYTWTFNSSSGASCQMTSNPGAASATIRAVGSNVWIYGYVSLTVKDNQTQATAQASADIQIQFGNAQQT